jgi:4-hydroxythreonine-4-phosphate dehydrogenase
MSEQLKPIIGISVGDLNGIGMEVIIKTFTDSAMLDFCTPVVFASSKVASYWRKTLNIENFSFNVINQIEQANPKKANLINCWKEEVSIEVGTPSKEVGKYAFQSLKLASKYLEEGKIQALVTAPINKNTIQNDEFKFTGHTDYLESRFDGKSLMMMVSNEMRMALSTVHVPLEKVASNITQEGIIEKLEILNNSLKNDFHIPKGKIAVLALNPHAGDGGVIGNEDETIVEPAIKKVFDKGIMAFGPFPADSFFGSGRHQQYDAVLAMYHDQGLIPFKSLSFGKGINYTAGLSIIRTSPDHGTGFEIAGTSQANESSFREAVYLACDLVKKRSITKEISEKPLKIRSGNKDI